MSKQQASTPIFPIYLIPTFTFPASLPFRKRQLSTSSQFSTGTNEAASSPNSGTENRSPTSTPSSNQSLSLRSIPSLTPISPPPTPTIIPRLHATHSPLIRCKTCTTHFASTSQIISKGFTGRHGRAYLISPPPAAPIPTTLPFPPKKLERALVNIRVGKSVRRHLATGLHVVADIECMVCGGVVGWKYVDAREIDQRYKIGKFILEGGRVVVGRGWEDEAEFENTTEIGEGESDYNFNDNGMDNEGGVVVGDRGNREVGFESDFGGEDSVEKGGGNINMEGRRQLRELEIEMGRRKPDCDGDGDEDIVIFNEDDEDECDDLFAGAWDAEVVRRRRWRKAKESLDGGLSLWRRREREEE